MKIFHLTCESMTASQIIDCQSPHFGWKIQSELANVLQIGYQLQVCLATDPTHVVWDSGQVASDQSSGIQYEGKPLTSKTVYCWRVIVSVNKQDPVASDLAFFETGFLKTEEWQAKWIEPAAARTKINSVGGEPDMSVGNTFGTDRTADLNQPVVFRKTFACRPEVAQAKLYMTAHGVYSVTLNGREVPINTLAPETTSYDKILQYQKYDVEALLESQNVLCVTVADGWYMSCTGFGGNGNNFGDQYGLLLQLDIQYSDGEQQVVISDDSFKTGTGPYIYSDLFIGEKYDATISRAFETTRFDDAAWPNAVVKDYPLFNLVAQMAEPVKTVGQLPALRVLYTPAGESVIDFGQNIAGTVTFKVAGKQGDQITLIHAEVLDRDGNFLFHITGKNKDQTDIFVLSGLGVEVFTPRFTFHGFRYVKVIGYPGILDAASFSANVLCSDLEPVSTFTCSNPDLNQLTSNILWSQIGNMLGVPTDCPQREKAGWTGDFLIFARAACQNMNMQAFAARWLKCLVVDQKDDGQIAMIVPNIERNSAPPPGMKTGTSPAWGDACIGVPWALYNFYGDINVLESTLDAGMKWLAFIEKRARENFVDGITEAQKEQHRYLWNTDFSFGDWLLPSLCTAVNGGSYNPVNATIHTGKYTGSLYFAYSTKLMSKICTLLNKPEQAHYYDQLNQKIRSAFASVYLDAAGRLASHLQGLYVLVLAMDAVPDELRPKVIANLVGLITDNGYRLDTGFASIGFLMDTLYDHGHQDIAYRLLFQTACPSWLYEVKQGATTIWESWVAIDPAGNRSNVSYNHYSYGCIYDFMVRKIGGINSVGAGFKSIRIEPDFTCGLTSADVSYDSIFGLIRSKWSIDKGVISLDVEIPCNTIAEVKFNNKSIHAGNGKFSFQFEQ